MSGNVFGADPLELQAKGGRINDISAQFKENYEKVFKTVEEMVNSNYLDPAARAIAENIFSYRTDLENMAKVINNYGNYCINAGNKVIQNQEDIISGIGGGTNAL